MSLCPHRQVRLPARGLAFIATLLTFLMSGAHSAWAVFGDQLDEVQAVYGYEAGSNDRVKYYSQDQASLDSNGNPKWMFTGTSGGAGFITDPTGGTIKWIVNLVSPRTGHQAIAFQTNSSANATAIYAAYSTTAGTWTSSLSNTSMGGTEPAYQQHFDMAEESKSGDFMVVYRDGAVQSQLRWKKLQTGTTGLVGNWTSNIAWVRLIASPVSNELLLGAIDGTGNLRTYRWDGSTWISLTPAPLVTSLVSGRHRQFDFAYEHLSGRAIVIYGVGNGGLEVRSRDDGPSPWSSSTGFLSAPAPQHATLAAQPYSQHIAAGMYIPGVVYGAMWNGAGCLMAPDCFLFVDPNPFFKFWSIDSSADTLNQGQDPVAVGWAGNTAILTYADQPSESTGLDWAFWPTGDGDDWSAQQSDVFPSSALQKLGFMMQPYLSSGRLLVTFADENLDLWSGVYREGSGWTMPDVQSSTTAPLETQLPSPLEGRPFSMANYAYVVPTIALAGGNVSIPAAAASATRNTPGIIITEQGAVIRKNDYIRIKIPPSFTLDWDTSVTSGLTFTPPSAADLLALDSTPYPDASNDENTVVFKVLRHFKPNEAVTINGLKFTKFTTASTVTDRLTLEVASTAAGTSIFATNPTNPTTTQTIQIVESLALAAPAAQVKNSFLSTGNLAGVELLRFDLGSLGGDVKVNIINFPLLTLTGIALADLPAANIQLYDLTSGQPGTVVPGTATTTSFGGDTIVVQPTNLTISSGTTMQFALRASVNNLAAGDLLLIQTDPGKVAVDGVTSGVVDLHTITGAITGPVIQKTHTVSTYTITAPTAGLKVKFQDPLTVSWTNVNTNNPTQFEYSLNGTTWTDFTGTPASGRCPNGGASPCTIATLPLPTSQQASGTASIRMRGVESGADAQTVGWVVSPTFKVLERLQLAAPATQVSNALRSTGTLTDLDLLKIDLNALGGSVGVTDVAFTVNPSGTINLTNYRLLNASNTVIAGPQASPIFSGLSGSEFSVATSGPTTYTLRADAAGLDVGEGLTVSLTAANVTSTGALTNEPLTAELGPVSKTHTVSTYVITAPTAGLKVTFQDPITVSWTKINVGEPIQFEYSADGKVLTDPTKTWLSFTGAGPINCLAGSSSPCTATQPTSTAATSLAYLRLTGRDLENQLIVPAVSAAFTVLERLELQPPATQVSNALTQAGALPDVALLSVEVKASGGGVELNTLRFTPVGAAIILAQYRLVDASGTEVAPPQASPVFAGLSGPNMTINAGASKVYTLRASVSDLGPGETLEVRLNTTDVAGRGLATNELLSSRGSDVSKTHVVSTYVITVTPQGQSELTAGTAWPIEWQTYGLANLTNVTVTLNVTPISGPPQQVSIACGTTYPITTLAPDRARCDAIAPDSVTAPLGATLAISDGINSGLSNTFTIGGVLSLTSINPLSLSGSDYWIVGWPATIDWLQAGSFNITIELSKDASNPVPNYTRMIVPGQLFPITNPDPVTGTQPMSWNFTPEKTDVTQAGQAKVQVRPTNLVTQTIGSRQSANFTIATAFSALEPGASTTTIVQSSNPIPITWTRLPGTEPGAPTFSIDNVMIRVLDENSVPIHTVTRANTGLYSGWVPSSGGSNWHIVICDASRPSVCAEGGLFNIVNPVLIVNPVPAPYAILGNDVQITGGQGLSGNVTLTLRDSGGAVLQTIGTLDVNLLSPSTGGYTWTIPTTGMPAAPISNAFVHLELVSNPLVFLDSSPFTIHGLLRNLSIAPGPPLRIENDQADASNDVVISWESIGSSPVRLLLSLNGGAFQSLQSTYGAAGANSIAGTNYTWSNIPSNAKAPQARLRVEQVNDGSIVFVESATPFAILGELVMDAPANGATFDFNTNPSIDMIWRTPRGPITPVRFRVIDVDDNNAVLDERTVVNTSNGTTPQTETWNPADTYASLQTEICDLADLSVCSTSGTFTVGGINLLAPATGARFVVEVSGVDVPIQWKPVGGSGAVRVEYSVAGVLQSPVIAAAATSVDNTTNTLAPIWHLPVTFSDLSSEVRVVLTDSTAGLSRLSEPFTIAGKLVLMSVTPPVGVGPEIPVRTPVDLAWNTYGGGITDVKLQYSTDGVVWKDGATITPNTGSLSGWLIPDDAISQSLQLRIIDVTANHPTADSPAFTITTTPSLTLIVPTGPWLAGESQTLQWDTLGLIDQVQLSYSVNGGAFQPLAGTPLPGGLIANTNGATQWQGSFAWTVADPLLPRDPGQYAPVSVVIKLEDASAGHLPIPQQSGAVSLIYLKVVWQVKDATTRNFLAGLNVAEQDLSGNFTWQVTDGSLSPNAVSPNPLGILRYYPLGTYTTTWTKPGNSESAIMPGWVAGRSQLVDFDGKLPGDDPVVDGIVLESFLELDVNKQIPWGIQQHFELFPGISPAPDQVLIMSWLEKRGILFDLVDQIDIEIRNGSQLVKTLSSAIHDGGVFRLMWDFTDDNGSPVDPDEVYFSKALFTLTTGGQIISGDALAMALARQTLAGGSSTSSGVTLAELQTELTPIATAVTQDLPTQLTAAQGAIQTSVATAELAIRTDVANVQADTDALQLDTAAIKAETDRISTEVIPKIDGVQAYLADPSSGLPALQDAMTQQADQLKSLRRGGILNRDTEVELGETIQLQYRSEGGAPALTIYDAAGAPVLAPPMLLNAATGLYEATVTLAALGEYRAVVAEGASANSAGTLDSVTLTVRPERASAQDVAGVASMATQLDALTTQLGTIESSLNGLMTTAAAIQTATTTTQTLATQASADTQTLLTTLDTLDGPQLMTELTTLTTRSENVVEQLEKLEEIVKSTEGSSAAVTASQGAYSAAAEAVKLLQQLRTGVQASGPGASNTRVVLTQAGEKLSEVSKTVGAFPVDLADEELGSQLKKLAEQTQGVATEKGYHFDALYEMAQSQSGDMETMNNRVAELKALLEVQRSILEQNLNQPVVKTWFESGY